MSVQEEDEDGKIGTMTREKFKPTIPQSGPSGLYLPLVDIKTTVPSH